MPGAVTIATNMAGRGTDIQLGGNLDMRLSQELDENADEGRRGEMKAKIETEIASAKQEALAAGDCVSSGRSAP